MPCACLIPVPAYPETSDWGPILWTILHGIAEQSQKSILPLDELREWPKFLKLTGDILPCDKCRAHYQRYLHSHPFTPTQQTYGTLKEWIKRWFFNLHNEINTENGKPIFLYEDLETTYKNVDFRDMIWRLEPVMKKAIQLNGIGIFKWRNWLNSLIMLRASLAI